MNPFSVGEPREPGQSTAYRRPRKGRGVSVLLFVALVAYASSYAALRARSVRQTAEFGLSGMLYVDAESVFERKSLGGLHHVLSVLYSPANFIDCMLFNGKSAIHGFTFDLVSCTKQVRAGQLDEARSVFASVARARYFMTRHATHPI